VLVGLPPGSVAEVRTGRAKHQGPVLTGNLEVRTMSNLSDFWKGLGTVVRTQVLD